MLGKMFIHGLVAAAIIGSAAAVYAQVKDQAPPQDVEARVAGQAAAKPDDGYIRPVWTDSRRERDRDGERFKSERHRERHDRKRDHDDDDD